MKFSLDEVEGGDDWFSQKWPEQPTISILIYGLWHQCYISHKYSRNLRQNFLLMTKTLCKRCSLNMYGIFPLTLLKLVCYFSFEMAVRGKIEIWLSIRLTDRLLTFPTWPYVYANGRNRLYRFFFSNKRKKNTWKIVSLVWIFM